MPSIGGNALAEQDLLTLVRVFEVDPTLKNKKITLNEFSKYLNTKYLTLSGGTLTGPVIVNATLTVSGDTSLANVSSSGNATFNSVFVQNNLTVTGTATAADVIGTTKVSGATVTGNTALFTSITGSTLRVTTPSGTSPAMVCSGIISGGVNGLVVKGPLIILP